MSLTSCCCWDVSSERVRPRVVCVSLWESRCDKPVCITVSEDWEGCSAGRANVLLYSLTIHPYQYSMDLSIMICHCKASVFWMYEEKNAIGMDVCPDCNHSDRSATYTHLQELHYQYQQLQWTSLNQPPVSPPDLTQNHWERLKTTRNTNAARQHPQLITRSYTNALTNWRAVV